MPSASDTGEIIDGLWRFVAIHPDWEDDSDGWDPEVAWWAIRTQEGIVLIDPLVTDWEALDDLISANRGCAGIVRTLYWHQRTIDEAADRYRAEVWARPAPADVPARTLHKPVTHGQPLPGGLVAYDVVRADEIAVHAPSHRALIFGDLLIRTRDGRLSLCPPSWIERAGGPDRMRAVLRALPDLEPRHVLVAHGPLVLGDGVRAFDQVRNAA